MHSSLLAAPECSTFKSFIGRSSTNVSTKLKADRVASQHGNHIIHHVNKSCRTLLMYVYNSNFLQGIPTATLVLIPQLEIKDQNNLSH